MTEDNFKDAIITVNFRGQAFLLQGWKFEILLNYPLSWTPTWIIIGDTNPNSDGWNSWKYVFFYFSFFFTTFSSHFLFFLCNLQTKEE